MNSRTPATPRRKPRRGHAPTITVALAALVLLAGCGGGGGSSATTSGTTSPVTTPVTTAPTGQSVSAPALSNFTASLSEDQSGISVGGTASYTLTLANTSTTPATVVAETSGGVNTPVASLHIIDPNGATVYPPVGLPGIRPHDGPPAPPGSGAVTLQPGQSLTLTRALSVFTRSGNYQAVATFTVAATAADTPQTVTLSALPLAVK